MFQFRIYAEDKLILINVCLIIVHCFEIIQKPFTFTRSQILRRPTGPVILNYQNIILPYPQNILINKTKPFHHELRAFRHAALCRKLFLIFWLALF